MEGRGYAIVRKPDAAFLKFAEGMFKASVTKGRAGRPTFV